MATSQLNVCNLNDDNGDDGDDADDDYKHNEYTCPNAPTQMSKIIIMTYDVEDDNDDRKRND